MTKRCLLLVLPLLAGTFCALMAAAQEQFPIMDKVADRVIQKYQQSSCPQLMAQRDKPKGPQEQRVIQLLHDDPQMRRAFIDNTSACPP